jgi:ADP-heptose:LPS heptosyltransferase
MNKHRANILVIKLGALGDFVQAFGPMAAIRKHHADEKITLLTTAPFESLARASGYFDEILLDKRPKWHDIGGWLSLRKILNGRNFIRVYDLQNNDRTAFYLKLFSPTPEWVGAAPGASHRNTSVHRTAGKAFDGHVQTLSLAGIPDVTPDTLLWMNPVNDYAHLPKPYVLLVVGASPQHPEKRWPHYAALCDMLVEKGFTPVIIGGPDEQDIASQIASKASTAIDLAGKTSLTDLPSLARGAAACVGNDTGPMHFIAPTGCPSIVLFSKKTNPVRHAPLGAHVITLQKDDLEKLEPGEVWAAFSSQALL